MLCSGRVNAGVRTWFRTFVKGLTGAALTVVLLGNAPAMAASPADEAGIDAPVDIAADREGQGGIFSRDTKDDSDRTASHDPQFRTLFLAWKRMDSGAAPTLDAAVPSHAPVDDMRLTSSFGYRSDPFRGRRAMHQGIDIPGPVGTPIYATADGFVGRAGRYGGYGNLIELEHGNGVQTRYGHLSTIMVQPGSRVRRGDIIGRMGSTGRSTGSHLHYEVRMDGEAVDPMPFVQSGRYVAEVAAREAGRDTAQGGPSGN